LPRRPSLRSGILAMTGGGLSLRRRLFTVIASPPPFPVIARPPQAGEAICLLFPLPPPPVGLPRRPSLRSGILAMTGGGLSLRRRLLLLSLRDRRRRVKQSAAYSHCHPPRGIAASPFATLGHPRNDGRGSVIAPPPPFYGHCESPAFYCHCETAAGG